MTGRIATGTETGPFECDTCWTTARSITVEIRENLIRGDSGEVTGICRSLLDVTERNLAAVAARKVAQYAMELRNKNEQLARRSKRRAPRPRPRAGSWPACRTSCARR